MRGIITTLFLVLISNSLSGAGELNANNILILFPICETPSSLGQRCKHNYAESIPDISWRYAVQMVRMFNTRKTVFQCHQAATGIITSTYQEVVMVITKSSLLIKQ